MKSLAYYKMLINSHYGGVNTNDMEKYYHHYISLKKKTSDRKNKILKIFK